MSTIQTVRENQGRYRITKPFSPQDFLLMLGAMVAILAGVAFLAAVLRIGLGWLLVAALPVPFGRYVAKRTAFGVVAQTVVVDGVHVPWELVREVAVQRSPAGGPTTFAVRLADAPALPPELRELAPAADGFHLRHTTARPYDPAKLAAALQRFAPAHVKVSGFDRSSRETA